MAIQPILIPPEWNWAFELVVGQDWPQADEDALRRLAQHWTDALNGLLSIAHDGNTAAQNVGYSVQAVSSDEFTDYWDTYTGGDDSIIGQMARQAEVLAAELLQFAEQTEFTKLSINIQIVLLLIQLVFDAATALISAGATTAEGIVAALITRLTVKNLLTELIKAVVMAVLPDVITQIVMLRDGHRSSFDVGETLQAAQMGVIGGLVGAGAGALLGGVGSGIGKWAGTALGKTIGEDAGKVVGNQVGKIAGAAITGAATNVTTNLVTGGVDDVENQIHASIDPQYAKQLADQSRHQGQADQKSSQNPLTAALNGAFTGVLFHGVHEAGTHIADNVYHPVEFTSTADNGQTLTYKAIPKADGTYAVHTEDYNYVGTGTVDGNSLTVTPSKGASFTATQVPEHGTTTSADTVTANSAEPNATVQLAEASHPAATVEDPVAPQTTNVDAPVTASTPVVDAPAPIIDPPPSPPTEISPVEPVAPEATVGTPVAAPADAPPPPTATDTTSMPQVAPETEVTASTPAPPQVAPPQTPSDTSSTPPAVPEAEVTTSTPAPAPVDAPVAPPQPPPTVAPAVSDTIGPVEPHTGAAELSSAHADLPEPSSPSTLGTTEIPAVHEAAAPNQQASDPPAPLVTAEHPEAPPPPPPAASPPPAAPGPDRSVPDLLQAAANPDVDLTRFTPEPVWRDDRTPLWRFEDRGPEEIFAEGFQPFDVNGDYDLNNYIMFNHDSPLVSTTRDADLGYGERGFEYTRYRYEIDAPYGIDLNATFPDGFVAAWQQEVSFPGGIDTRYIKGVWIRDATVGGEPFETWMANPHYDPNPDLGGPTSAKAPTGPLSPEPGEPPHHPQPAGVGEGDGIVGQLPPAFRAAFGDAALQRDAALRNVLGPNFDEPKNEAFRSLGQIIPGTYTDPVTGVSRTITRLEDLPQAEWERWIEFGDTVSQLTGREVAIVHYDTSDPGGDIRITLGGETNARIRRPSIVHWHPFGYSEAGRASDDDFVNVANGLDAHAYVRIHVSDDPEHPWQTLKFDAERNQEILTDLSATTVPPPGPRSGSIRPEQVQLGELDRAAFTATRAADWLAKAAEQGAWPTTPGEPMVRHQIELALDGWAEHPGLEHGFTEAELSRLRTAYEHLTAITGEQRAAGVHAEFTAEDAAAARQLADHLRQVAGGVQGRRNDLQERVNARLAELLPNSRRRTGPLSDIEPSDSEPPPPPAAAATPEPQSQPSDSIVNLLNPNAHQAAPPVSEDVGFTLNEINAGLDFGQQVDARREALLTREAENQAIADDLSKTPAERTIAAQAAVEARENRIALEEAVEAAKNSPDGPAVQAARRVLTRAGMEPSDLDAAVSALKVREQLVVIKDREFGEDARLTNQWKRAKAALEAHQTDRDVRAVLAERAAEGDAAAARLAERMASHDNPPPLDEVGRRAATLRRTFLDRVARRIGEALGFTDAETLALSDRTLAAEQLMLEHQAVLREESQTLLENPAPYKAETANAQLDASRRVFPENSAGQIRAWLAEADQATSHFFEPPEPEPPAAEGHPFDQAVALVQGPGRTVVEEPQQLKVGLGLPKLPTSPDDVLRVLAGIDQHKVTLGGRRRVVVTDEATGETIRLTLTERKIGTSFNPAPLEGLFGVDGPFGDPSGPSALGEQKLIDLKSPNGTTFQVLWRVVEAEKFSPFPSGEGPGVTRSQVTIEVREADGTYTTANTFTWDTPSDGSQTTVMSVAEQRSARLRAVLKVPTPVGELGVKVVGEVSSSDLTALQDRVARATSLDDIARAVDESQKAKAGFSVEVALRIPGTQIGPAASFSIEGDPSGTVARVNGVIDNLMNLGRGRPGGEPPTDPALIVDSFLSAAEGEEGPRPAGFAQQHEDPESQGAESAPPTRAAEPEPAAPARPARPAQQDHSIEPSTPTEPAVRRNIVAELTGSSTPEPRLIAPPHPEHAAPPTPDLPAIEAPPNHPELSGHLFGDGDRLVIGHPGDPILSTGLAPVDGNGAFVVEVHGRGGSVLAGDQAIDVTSPEFRELLTRAGWREGRPVLLASCEAGLGEHSSAERLAAALGVDVVASDVAVWKDRHGNVIAASLVDGEGGARPRLVVDEAGNLAGDGTWKVFHPGGQGRVEATDLPAGDPRRPAGRVESAPRDMVRLGPDLNDPDRPPFTEDLESYTGEFFGTRVPESPQAQVIRAFARREAQVTVTPDPGQGAGWRLSKEIDTATGMSAAELKPDPLNVALRANADSFLRRDTDSQEFQDFMAERKRASYVLDKLGAPEKRVQVAKDTLVEAQNSVDKYTRDFTEVPRQRDQVTVEIRRLTKELRQLERAGAAQSELDAMNDEIAARKVQREQLENKIKNRKRFDNAIAARDRAERELRAAKAALHSPPQVRARAFHGVIWEAEAMRRNGDRTSDLGLRAQSWDDDLRVREVVDVHGIPVDLSWGRAGALGYTTIDNFMSKGSYPKILDQLGVYRDQYAVRQGPTDPPFDEAFARAVLDLAAPVPAHADGPGGGLPDSLVALSEKVHGKSAVAAFLGTRDWIGDPVGRFMKETASVMMLQLALEGARNTSSFETNLAAWTMTASGDLPLERTLGYLNVMGAEGGSQTGKAADLFDRGAKPTGQDYEGTTATNIEKIVESRHQDVAARYLELMTDESQTRFEEASVFVNELSHLQVRQRVAEMRMRQREILALLAIAQDKVPAPTDAQGLADLNSYFYDASDPNRPVTAVAKLMQQLENDLGWSTEA